MATILLLDVRQINLTAKDIALNMGGRLFIIRQINLTAKDIALNLQYRLIKAVSFAVGFSQWNR